MQASFLSFGAFQYLLEKSATSNGAFASAATATGAASPGAALAVDGQHDPAATWYRVSWCLDSRQAGCTQKYSTTSAQPAAFAPHLGVVTGTAPALQATVGGRDGHVGRVCRAPWRSFGFC